MVLAEQQFLKLLQHHTDALSDRRRFTGLLKDFMPGMALQSNLLINLYDLNIHGEIEKAQQLDNSLCYRFTKMICDEYGVSRRNSEWAVSAWFTCYGTKILGKKAVYAVPPSQTGQSAFETASANSTVAAHKNTPGERPLDTTFDVATSDYYTDWRNIYEYDIEYGGTIIRRYIDFESYEVTVPDAIEGYPVVEISDEAFINCKEIKVIHLPCNLKLIRRKAFENCTFESIELPESLIEFQYKAFGSGMLKSVRIPSRIVRINRYVFSGCRELTDVRLPDALMCIEGYAFQNCTALTSIDIPLNVKEIGEYAFGDCSGLVKIRIPRSVLSMGRPDCDFENIFGTGKNQNLTIYCEGGSEALKYARRFGISVDRYENYIPA